MTLTIITKARNLAVAIEHNVSEEIAAYSPKLKEAAERAEQAYDNWQSAVEHWIETHFEPAAETAKQEASRAYTAVLRTLHDLHEEARRKVN